ncbi:MAG: hypothetical protein Q4P23_06625 [Micrococcaceae bacterium]|nr:hypothetical protein [Micrococcaceae bacterium]
MGTASRAIRGIALRTAVLVGLYLLVWVVLLRFEESSSANIGAGLISFAVIALLSALGGLYDGTRGGFSRLAITWVATAMLTAVALIALIDPFLPFDLEVFLFDLLELGPFMAALVAIPALLGGGVGALMPPQGRSGATESAGSSPVPGATA